MRQWSLKNCFSAHRTSLPHCKPAALRKKRLMLIKIQTCTYWIHLYYSYLSQFCENTVSNLTGLWCKTGWRSLSYRFAENSKWPRKYPRNLLRQPLFSPEFEVSFSLHCRSDLTFSRGDVKAPLLTLAPHSSSLLSAPLVASSPRRSQPGDIRAWRCHWAAS